MSRAMCGSVSRPSPLPPDARVPRPALRSASVAAPSRASSPRSRAATASRRRRAAARRARSTSSPVPRAERVRAAMGWPRGQGWCVCPQGAQVLRCARIRWSVASLQARCPARESRSGGGGAEKAVPGEVPAAHPYPARAAESAKTGPRRGATPVATPAWSSPHAAHTAPPTIRGHPVPRGAVVPALRNAFVQYLGPHFTPFSHVIGPSLAQNTHR
jgi:hypothetical protein